MIIFPNSNQNSNLENIVICIFTVLIILIIFRMWNRHRGLTKLKQNNASYTVAKAPNKEESARMLAEIRRRMKTLIDYCASQYPDDKNVKLMNKRFKPENIQETSLHDSGTSYTIDKGKELHLCLRDKTTKKHHDVNLLMFVSIHELAHMMSSSYGHNNEFSKNFKFLLEKAVECNVYHAEDYNRNPRTFCGIKVKYSPLF